jgi:hypothetical protein
VWKEFGFRKKQTQTAEAAFLAGAAAAVSYYTIFFQEAPD